MTNQEKKQWLLRYWDCRNDLDSLIEEQKEWRARVTRITPSLNGTPGGGSERGATEAGAIKLAELDGEIDAQLRRCKAVRQETLSAIGRVKDPTLRSLLRLRYINALRFEKIADRMHYSVRWVLKLHGRALDQLRVKEDMEVHIDPW